MPGGESFSKKLIAWQRRRGRRGLPWQGTRDPYRVWLAEVMLQQTQVAAVIPYYERFVSRFPDVNALASASQEQVLELWSGLGYYARGRNLHAAAREIVRRGGFPRTAEAIRELPGIGRSTAAAIAAFAFGRRAAILDGNVKRVLARCFAVEGENGLWRLAERLLPQRGIERYTQALMDLGATVCTRRKPRCDDCPVKRRCVARRDDRVHELPAPRQRRALPLKKATWFVYLHAGRVLLERRPPSGIWGGLWSFPENKSSGIKVRAKRKLPPIEHGFTHFRLLITPVLHEVVAARARAEAPGRLWIDLSDAPHAAVPTPVRKLLWEVVRLVRSD